MVATVVAAAVHAAPSPVRCTAAPAILDVYRHATTAPAADWRGSRQAVYALMAACPEGPADAASRHVLFGVLGALSGDRSA